MAAILNQLKLGLGGGNGVLSFVGIFVELLAFPDLTQLLLKQFKYMLELMVLFQILLQTQNG